jgi:hypothetical protein
MKAVGRFETGIFEESIVRADVTFWCGLGYRHSVGCRKGSF